VGGVFYKFGVNFTPKPFFIAIPLYFIYLCALHRVFSEFKERRWFWLTGVAIGGITGLLLEWFLPGEILLGTNLLCFKQANSFSTEPIQFLAIFREDE
jgi:hypothetical protein